MMRKGGAQGPVIFLFEYGTIISQFVYRKYCTGTVVVPLTAFSGEFLGLFE